MNIYIYTSINLPYNAHYLGDKIMYFGRCLNMMNKNVKIMQ